VLFLISPVAADTVEEARAKKLRRISDPLCIELGLATMSSLTELSFSRPDLDEPVGAR
jgi:hypothetical protein